MIGDHNDHLVGETNAFSKETLPNGVWRRYEDTGRLVNLELAKAFNQILVDFVG